MKNSRTIKRAGSSRIRGIVAILGCVFGIGLIFLGLKSGTMSAKNEASAGANPIAERQNKKPVRAWNIALGNVVLVAPELGLGVKSGKESGVEPDKIAARIASQLQSVRELYRQESDKNPMLMGGLMLQLNIAPSGEVIQVKELVSRITDNEFKKAVIAEASQWSFQEIVSASVTIHCPLLFVREGMDITTLVQWEKSLGQFAANDARPIQQSKTAAVPAPALAKAVHAASERPGQTLAAKKVVASYQIKDTTSLRKEPNFASPLIAKLPVGMKVNMLDGRGDWLEVRSEDSSLAGFVRKEFVSPYGLAPQP